MNKCKQVDRIVEDVMSNFKRKINESALQERNTGKIDASSFVDTYQKLLGEYEKAKRAIASAPSLGEIGNLIRLAGFQCSYNGFSVCNFFGRYAIMKASNYDSKWVLSPEISFIGNDDKTRKFNFKNGFLIGPELAQDIAGIYNGILDIITGNNPYDSTLPNPESINEICVIPDVWDDCNYRKSIFNDKLGSSYKSYMITYQLNENEVSFFIKKRYARLVLLEDVSVNNKYLNVQESIYFNSQEINKILTPREKCEQDQERDTTEYKITSESNRTTDYVCTVVGFENAKKKAYELAQQSIDSGKRNRDMCSPYYHSHPIETSDKHLAQYAYEYYNYQGRCYWYEIKKVQ